MQKTRIPCPEGRFCPHKTSADSPEGGSTKCMNCPEGAETKRLSNKQRIVQLVFLCLFLALLLLKIFRRKVRVDQEMLKRKLKLDSIRSRREDKRSSKTAVRREGEKYDRLRPKLELIATRLDRVRHGNDPQAGRDPGEPSTPKSLDKATSILYLSKDGDIVLDASDLYDVLDKDKDGYLSFSELNEVLCLKEEQLWAFIESIRGRMTAGYSPEHCDKVTRAVFVKNFLDVLADASELEPTEEDAADLFDRIAEEVGANDSGEVPYDELYNSSLSLFLSDLQIHSIIRRFRQEQGRGRQKGISKPEFVERYPAYLGAVTMPDWKSESVADLGANDLGLDVAFEDLCLTVRVGKREVNVVDHVSGRLRSNTMTAFMGGSGCGKSSFLNALCGRAYYGEVTGTVRINGNDSSIEDHKALIGFVPQV